MSNLELLTSLGLPSAIVGMVVVALIFKKSHVRVSTAAATMAVALVGIYGVIQLFEAASGKDVVITTSPSRIQALTDSGPTALAISVSRGKAVLASTTIPRESNVNFEAVLRDLGYTRYDARSEKDVPDSVTRVSNLPLYWSTNRVYAGQTQTVGLTRYGLLRLHAWQYTSTGDAVVTLELLGRDPPIPDTLTIQNKRLDVQSFLGIPEFFVAVREADFTDKRRPWAAFSVFTKPY